MKREDIIKAARTYVGSPWIHQGRNFSGIDCVGLYIGVGKAFNYPLQDFDGAYKRRPEGTLLLERMRLYNDEIEIGEYGDIVLIRFPRDEYPQHLGFLANNGHTNTIIHAINNTGFSGTVEEPYKRWTKHSTNFFRFRGVED